MQQHISRSDPRGIGQARKQTKERAMRCMDAVQVDQFVAMATFDETEGEDGTGYYIAEIKRLKQGATAEQRREWGSQTPCPINKQPVKKGSPLYLARYWVRKQDLRFEQSEYGECEVNGEGFRCEVAEGDFELVQQHANAVPKRVLSQAKHAEILDLLRA